MRALTLSLVAALAALVGCDLLTPPPVLGSGERRPSGDEGEGEGEEGEGEEGEGEEGEGEEGEGEVPGGCEAGAAGAITSGDLGGAQLDAEFPAVSAGANLVLQFFGDAHPAGTYPLSGGVNDNYGTCNECVLVVSDTQQWFQSGDGVLELDDDPALAGHYAGSVSGVVLEEVTIDQTTAVSTPVAGGSCFDLAGWSFDFTA